MADNPEISRAVSSKTTIYTYSSIGICSYGLIPWRSKEDDDKGLVKFSDALLKEKSWKTFVKVLKNYVHIKWDHLKSSKAFISQLQIFTFNLYSRLGFEVTIGNGWCYHLYFTLATQINQKFRNYSCKFDMFSSVEAPFGNVLTAGIYCFEEQSDEMLGQI